MQILIKLSPSILSADFGKLAEEVRCVEQAGADMLHIDVMDGHFVPNITIGPAVVGALRPESSLLFDVHLMITHPLDYIDAFADAGADLITFHVESASDPVRTIEKIRGRGILPAISLSPDTPVEAVVPYLPLVRMALVMTVYPGFGGQKFIEPMLEKVSALRAYSDAQGLALDIQVDGGIDCATAPAAAAAGANVLVAGSAVFGKADRAQALRRIRQATAG